MRGVRAKNCGDRPGRVGVLMCPRAPNRGGGFTWMNVLGKKFVADSKMVSKLASLVAFGRPSQQVR